MTKNEKGEINQGFKREKKKRKFKMLVWMFLLLSKKKVQTLLSIIKKSYYAHYCFILSEVKKKPEMNQIFELEKCVFLSLM